MRIEAGGWDHYATDGTYVNCRPRLGRSQVDVLVAALRRRGRCPICVTAVEMDEGGFKIEPDKPRWDCDHR